jgi:hypothetical protein
MWSFAAVLCATIVLKIELFTPITVALFEDEKRTVAIIKIPSFEVTR